MKERIFEKLLTILSLQSDHRYDILDVGCGQGILLGKVNGIVGNTSKLIGMDSDEKAIEQAKINYPDIDFLQEKFVDSFSFPDAAFDLIISVDTLECIPNKNTMLKEIHRILKKNGRILFAHWDWDTQAYNSKNQEVIRRFVAANSDWQQEWMDACDGRMGRKLWGIFQSSGLFNGTIEIFSLIETKFTKGTYGHDILYGLYNLVKDGKLDETEFKMIIDEMKMLHEKDQYFYSLNSYIYFGKKT